MIIVKNNGLEVIVGKYAHLHPKPSRGEVDSLYVNDVYTDEWVTKEIGEHLSKYWYAYYEHKKNILEKYADNDSFVDVGSGLGWFLGYIDYYSSKFTRVIGVEPSPRANSICMQDVVSSIDDIPEEFIDSMVHLSLVLEHILEPLEFILDIKPIAKNIMVVVPNEFNPLQKLFGGYWFVHKHHINYFTSRTIVTLLNDAGYKVEYVGATFPMELFLFFGNYRKDAKYGKLAHIIRLRFEKLLGWRVFSLYRILHKMFGIGREVIVVARRIDG